MPTNGMTTTYTSELIMSDQRQRARREKEDEDARGVPDRQRLTEKPLEPPLDEVQAGHLTPR
jgi:hypothetical protein